MSESPETATPLGEIIATRRYFRPPQQGGEFLAEIAIGRPVPSPTSPEEVVCPFRIIIKEQELIRIARGVDALHAFLMAFAYLEGGLNVLKETLDGQICYLGGEVGDLGLKIPDLAAMYGSGQLENPPES